MITIRKAYPEDILLSVRAPVGDINMCNVESCIGRGLASIKPKIKIEEIASSPQFQPWATG